MRIHGEKSCITKHCVILDSGDVPACSWLLLALGDRIGVNQLTIHAGLRTGAFNSICPYRQRASSHLKARDVALTYWTPVHLKLRYFVAIELFQTWIKSVHHSWVFQFPPKTTQKCCFFCKEQKRTLTIKRWYGHQTFDGWHGIIVVGEKCNYSSLEIRCEKGRSSIVVWLPMSAFAIS